MKQFQAEDRPSATVGLLIPEFPQQTHCAWWRVGNAFQHHGISMKMLSTRVADKQRQCHDFLIEESKHTHYIWPPSIKAIVGFYLKNPRRLIQGLKYLKGLSESSFIEKIKLSPLLVAGADLAVHAHNCALNAIFVHSCANAAHVAAICRCMGGPPYALRLGGDLEVYGKDHASKMRGAAFIASSAPNYFDQLTRDAGVEPSKLMWTWVGCDLESFTPADRRWGRQSEDALHAITVARLTDTKGHADILRALKILKEREITVRYTMIGAGPERQNLEIMVKSLGLDDRVVFAGSKSMDEVVKYLRKSDVSILASYGLGESSPAVVAEAMACGVPVICTRIGATHQMFRDGFEGVLVPQRDPQAIADALARLSNDESLRQTMARAAFAHSSVFDCKEVAKRVLTYFGLLDGPKYSAPAGLCVGSESLSDSLSCSMPISDVKIEGPKI